MRSRIGSEWHWQFPVITALVIAWLGFGLIRWHRLNATPAYTPRPTVVASANRLVLEAELDSLATSLDTTRLRYDDARRFYKRAEALTTFYSPTAAGVLDGPEAAPESDGPPEPLGKPAAFAIIDAWLRAGSPAALRDSTMRAAHRAREAIEAFRDGTAYLDVSDSSTLDAARLELARISTVGISGSGTLGEAANAIDGVRELVSRLSFARENALATHAMSRLAHAAATLRVDTSFDRFDRFDFISREMLPASRAILDLRRSVDSSPPAARRLWRATSASPYETNAFDPWALAPEYARDQSSRTRALGARLFSDTRLSGPGDRSCATCHQPSRAFSDRMVIATAIHGSSAHLRNTPTLINAALQPAMFADMRAGFVEDQIRIVLASPGEMGSSLAIAAERTSLDERTIATSLAAYIRSLTALRSPFDRAIRGDSTAITADAKRGFNLFMGKARCATCHFAPLFSGTIPPEFARSEPEVIGVPSKDVGRMAITGSTLHRGAFRVPSVRNSAVTAPYMHDGSLKTLQDVIDFYDRGGRATPGVTNLTLPSRPLHLLASEKRSVIAFLQSLTDTAVVAKP